MENNTQTNAQAALQAAATFYVTRAMNTGYGKNGAYTAEVVTQAADQYLRWLDQQDATAERRALSAQAQRVADLAREQNR